MSELGDLAHQRHDRACDDADHERQRYQKNSFPRRTARSRVSARLEPARRMEPKNSSASFSLPVGQSIWQFVQSRKIARIAPLAMSISWIRTRLHTAFGWGAYDLALMVYVAACVRLFRPRACGLAPGRDPKTQTTGQDLRAQRALNGRGFRTAPPRDDSAVGPKPWARPACAATSAALISDWYRMNPFGTATGRQEPAELGYWVRLIVAGFSGWKMGD
jgi:hypothetical protein